MKTVNYNPKLRLYVFLILITMAVFFNLLGSYFTKFFVSELIILSIFALSLDFIASRGGMVSLGHAMFLGIGAYCTAFLSIQLEINPFLSTILAFFIGNIFGLIIGNFIVSTGGIFFIMISLALGEMFHSWVFTSDYLGGSDGITGIPRPSMAKIGLDTNDPLIFSFYTILWLIITYTFLARLADSPFGRMLDAIRQNQNRVSSIGGATKTYKTFSFSISAGVAALSGSLYSQLNGFISPELTHWTVSGEGLIMIIIGGIGSMSGALMGATVVHTLQHEISNLINWWMLVIGLLFIFIVLFMEKGLWGVLERVYNLLSKKSNKCK